MNNEVPIRMPGNPFWNVFKRFGRDEAISMVINVAGTAIVNMASTSTTVLSLTGPIVEKIGFFPAHIYESIKIYKTTPTNKRKSYGHYLKKAFKGGFTSLAEDILVHDPVYIYRTDVSGTQCIPWNTSVASKFF